MAKVVYWESPIDPNKKRNLRYKDVTISKILKDLEIQDESLGLSINGEFPEDVDLEYVVKDDDVIEILKAVNGNDDAEGKNTLATVISIAALVAATILTAGGASPYLIAGISLLSGVASGALRYRAAKIIARNASADKGEVDISTNNFSINAASNESRPLQPLTVAMGSHRYAPDYGGQPYGGFSGGVSTNAAQVVDSAINPIELTPSYLSAMDIIPAGFLSRPITWPAYPVKLINELDLATISSLTPTERQNLAPLFPTPLIGVPFSDVSMPLVIYHHDLADPYYGRFSLFAFFELQDLTGKTLSEAIDEYNAWFDYSYAQTTSWYVPLMNSFFSLGTRSLWQLFYGGFVSLNRILGQLAETPGPNSVINSRENLPVWVNQVLNGGYSYPTTMSGFIPFRAVEIVEKFTEPPSRDVIHIFNFGLGDLTVSERAIEKTPLAQVQGFINDPIFRAPVSNWTLPDIFTTFPPRPVITNVKILEGSSLVNNTEFSGPQSIVGPNDLNVYNFVFRATPKSCYRVEIDFEGSLYATNNSGIIENSTTIEIQYRPKGSATWTGIRLEQFRNASALPTRKTSVFNFNLSSETEFRIRKLITDANNNEEKKIAQIDMISFKCFVGSQTRGVEASDMIGQTVESLLLTANSQTSGQTNKFTAQVDAKCWVYDALLDQWTWEFSRNPAWWFLYFARGGFKNQAADGTFVFPWSPTYGWVNGPGHPTSTDTMFGCGLFDDEIDIEGIKEWAVFCEDNNLFFDAVIRDETNSNEILEKIANVGRGSVSYYKGFLGVVFEDPLATPTGLYGMGNIIKDSFAVDYSVINTPSKVIATFSDRNEDWESKQVEATVPFAVSDDLNFINISLDGVTELQQAQREVNILAARQYFQKRLYTWKVDHEGLIARRGDLVYLSHDMTQYGWSGRVVKFIYDISNVITGLETTSQFTDTEITHVTIREPDGNIQTYQCSISGCNITFIDNYPIARAPQYPDGTEDFDNTASLFSGSYPDDFIFLAGPKETPGKLVRISEIKSDKDMVFTISAVDEDPAMWSYEFGPSIPPESFDDSEIVLRVFNSGYQRLEPGVVKIFWEVEGADFVKIINEKTGLPIESNGAFSFSGGQVVVELTEGSKYNLRIEAFIIGAPYAQIPERIVVWP